MTAPLTPRELEVLRLLPLPNKQIAHELRLSEHTVAHVVTVVLAKLGVGSRGEAIHEAHRAGMMR